MKTTTMIVTVDDDGGGDGEDPIPISRLQQQNNSFLSCLIDVLITAISHFAVLSVANSTGKKHKTQKHLKETDRKRFI